MKFRVLLQCWKGSCELGNIAKIVQCSFRMPPIKIKPSFFQRDHIFNQRMFFFPNQGKDPSNINNDVKIDIILIANIFIEFPMWDTLLSILHHLIYTAFGPPVKSCGLLLSRLTLQLNGQYSFIHEMNIYRGPNRCQTST